MAEKTFAYDANRMDEAFYAVLEDELFYQYEHVEPYNFSLDLVELRDVIRSKKDLIPNFRTDKNIKSNLVVSSYEETLRKLKIELQNIFFFKPDLDYDENYSIDLVKYVNYESPTKIPISFVDNPKEVRTGLRQFKREGIVVYKRIYLPKYELKMTGAVYAHELAHVSQNCPGRCLKRLTNEETLPILMELLYSNAIDDTGFTNNVFKSIRLSFLADMVDRLLIENLDYENRMVAETYLISIIQAFDLFKKYLEGTENNKKEFIEFINRIIAREKYVEQMLNTYESNYRDIEPNINQITRKLQREL